MTTTTNYRLIQACLLAAALAACANGPQEPQLSRPQEPELSRMTLAQPVGKIGVPVDVRYQLSGTVSKDQPTALELAFVPRIEGTQMRVEFPASDAVSIETGGSPLAIQKASKDGVYRRSLLVTPRKADRADLQAVVSMDVEGGRYFSVFSIPIGTPPPASQPGAQSSGKMQVEGLRGGS